MANKNSNIKKNVTEKSIDKKKNIKKGTNEIVSNNELTNLIKVVVIVCAFLLVFYFITVLVKKNQKKTSTADTNVQATIQYSKIMVGEILNRSESDYFVLVQKEDDSYIDLYNSYLSIYSSKENALKTYTVDLSDIFNSNNIGEENVVSGNNVSEYKFANTTLLKISNGSLVEVYDSSDSISSYLESLIK